MPALRLAIVGLFFLGAAAVGLGQTVRQEEPLVIRSVFGQDLYQFYCSNCHGTDGKGRAPKTALRTPPPDLTAFTRSNGGVFPRERVQTAITEGGITPTHGTKDMPVWGWIFRGLDASDTLVEVRINNLVRYIESIQEP